MTLKSFILASLLCLSATAQAHEAAGPNGGRIADAGDYHVELVAKDTALDVFISDAAD